MRLASGFPPPREFDVQFYLATYPDLQAAFGTNYRAALDHWVIFGISEGRKRTPG